MPVARHGRTLRMLSYVALILVAACVVMIHYVVWSPVPPSVPPHASPLTLQCISVAASALILARSSRKGPARLWLAILPLCAISAYWLWTVILPTLLQILHRTGPSGIAPSLR